MIVVGAAAVASTVAETASAFWVVLLIAAVTLTVLLPLNTLLHEAAHAFTGKILGLELGGVIFGSGRALWTGEVLGVPVQMQSLSTFGRTYLGCYGCSRPRLRLWIATLMGPALNAAMVALGLHFWEPLSNAVGVPVAALWIATNAFSLVVNLFPFAFEEQGQRYRSDGLAMLQIPGAGADTMASYGLVAPTIRAWLAWERADYAASRSAALLGLTRDPDNAFLQLTVAACMLHAKETDAALVIFRRSSADPDIGPLLRAFAKNDAAVALLLLKRGTQDEAAALAEADELSRQAFEDYPCLLSLRCGRALILSWRGDGDEALRLLEYPHFAHASREHRADRIATQAFALRSLGRTEEASRAVAAARRISPASVESLAIG